MQIPSPVSFAELDTEALITGGIVMAFAVIFGGIALLQTYCEHNHVNVLREASVPIIIGLLIGLITFIGYFDQGLYFDSKIFFFALLPIIVFKEGYSLNKQHFMKNFFYVILYGVFGTIFQFIILLGLNYSLTNSTVFWHPPVNTKKEPDVTDLSFYAQMFFSACITSKDSAVSLSVLEFEHAPKLHSIIFGEQIVNDVIVFALSKTAQRYNDPEANITFGDWYNFLIFIALVLAQLLVGLCVGVVVGLFATWITKSARFISEHSSIVTAFTIYVAYFAFCLCEAFDFCGVMAVLICGIMMSHYQTYNLPKLSANSSKITIKALAYVSETFIYFYIGFAVTGSEINNQTLDYDVVYPFILLQFFAIQPVARLLAMLLSHGIAFLFHIKAKGRMRINRYEFLILFYAGLIKGVVAYALICEDEAGGEQYYVFINYATLYLVLGTTVLIGGTLKYVAEWSFEQMEIENLKESSVNSEQKSGLKKTFIQEDVKAYEQLEKGKSQKWFSTFDEDYIKPFFIYKYLERKEDILAAKKIKKNRHNLEKAEEEEMKLYEESVKEHRQKALQKKSKLTELEIEEDDQNHNHH